MRILKTAVWFAVALALGSIPVVSAQSVIAKEETMSLTITSDAFVHEGEIPLKYTCQGEDVAPALAWAGIPDGTKSLVLIVDDPDAPDPKAPKMTWVHWVIFNIPPTSARLPEGASPDDIPQGAGNGISDFGRTGYGGPCPPIGRHRYFFKLYALDTVLPGLNRPKKSQVVAAMQGHILEESVLMGTYQKTR